MLKVENISDATAEEWDAAWRGCEYSTFFHSRDWAEIWCSYTRESISLCPRAVRFSDGLAAVIPLCSRRMYKGLAVRYLSSPAGTYGGWISADPLGPDHGSILAETMISLGNLEWRINPYCEIAPRSGLPGMKDDVTHSIKLKNDFEKIFNNWSRRNRSEARQSMNLGITVRLASSLDDWKGYYHVYEDSLRRWGDHATSMYSFELFHEMFKRKSPGIKLWLAEFEEKPVAGALCLYTEKCAVYWHGASLEDHFHRKPVKLLFFEAIKDSCANGHGWFDFNPSGGHEGVKEFKRRFGAIALPAPVVSIQPKIVDFVSRLIK